MKNSHLLTLIASTLLLSTTASAGNYPPENVQMGAAKKSTTEKPAVTNQATPAAVTNAAPSTTAASSNTMIGNLGIGTDILPSSVAAQMPDSISPGQGIIVTRFAENSQAKKSGIKVHDVLLAYDDTKIIHPEQFIKLIHEDKPGRDVKLQLLRNGELITQTVTLGMQKVVNTSNEVPANYTGLAIKKTGENIYDASIGIPTQNGAIQRVSFKGTREQIFKQVMAAKNLPQQERKQLLYALQGGSGSQTQKNNNGPWNMMPFGNNNNEGGGFFPFGGNKGNNNSFFPNFFNSNR